MSTALFGTSLWAPGWCFTRRSCGEPEYEARYAAVGRDSDGADGLVPELRSQIHPCAMGVRVELEGGALRRRAGRFAARCPAGNARLGSMGQARAPMGG